MVKKSEESIEAQAYTPGLKVKRSTAVDKLRRLPIPGEVLVKIGDIVQFDTKVARSLISGDPEIVRVTDFLGVDPEDIQKYLIRHKGEKVMKGEIIASYSGLFGLVKKQLSSPRDGTIESISEATGQIVIRGNPVPIEVDAYIPGLVKEILPREGALIAANAAFIQGIFGIGGETHGMLSVVVDDPSEELTIDKIDDKCRNKILVGGSIVTLDALKKAAEIKVQAIVVGGVRHNDLTSFTGQQIGVAITGQEDVGITLIITEGFGKMSMSSSTFKLLKSFDGKLSCVNGATQIRAGVQRPEIIIPHEETTIEDEEELKSGMISGTPVRIIRQPYFGAIGVVNSLPVELQPMESESYVRVLTVKLQDGTLVTVPRANVEIIEE